MQVFVPTIDFQAIQEMFLLVEEHAGSDYTVVWKWQTKDGRNGVRIFVEPINLGGK